MAAKTLFGIVWGAKKAFIIICAWHINFDSLQGVFVLKQNLTDAMKSNPQKKEIACNKRIEWKTEHQ